LRGTRQKPKKRDGLNPAQHRALLVLLSGKSPSEAARAANVCRQTVSEWLHHDRCFMDALHAGRQQYVAQVRRIITESAVEAAKLLRTTMRSRRATPGEKIRAAQIVLDKLPELDALEKESEPEWDDPDPPGLG